MRVVVSKAGFLAFLFLALLEGCGKSPSSADINAAISKAVLEGRTAGLEVTTFKVEKWNISEKLDNGNQYIISTWTATLHFSQTFGYVTTSIGDKPIVQPVVQPGKDLEYSGTISAEWVDDKWRITAFNSNRPWAQIMASTGAIPRAYRACDDDGMPLKMVTRNAGYAGVGGYPLQAVSEISGAIILGTPDGNKFMADVAVRQKAREAADAAKAQKLREEAEAKRQAAIAPWLAPFKSKSGAIITTDGNIAIGSLITDATIDSTNLKITGKGIDLNQMPFREFTFDGALDPKTLSSLTIKTTLTGAAMTFNTHNEKGLTGADSTLLAPLEETSRARLDANITLGRKLSSSAPLSLHPDIYDPPTATTRQSEFKTKPLTGAIVQNGKRAPALTGLFSGNLAKDTKVFNWTKGTIAIRLDAIASGSGLYVAASNSESDGFTLIINGVHKIKLDSLPTSAGIFILLPPDFQLLDLRIESEGIVHCRGIILVE